LFHLSWGKGEGRKKKRVSLIIFHQIKGGKEKGVERGGKGGGGKSVPYILLAEKRGKLRFGHFFMSVWKGKRGTEGGKKVLKGGGLGVSGSLAAQSGGGKKKTCARIF